MLNKGRKVIEADKVIPDHNPHPIVVTNLEGQVVYYNPSAEKLLPFISEGSLLHLSSHWLGKVKEAFVAAQRLGSRFTAGPYVYAVDLIPVNESVHIYFNDLTSFSYMQDKLKESDERFRILAEFSTDVISRHDVNGDFIYVSPAAQQVLGYGFEELIGKPVFHFIHEEDQKTAIAHLVSKDFERGSFLYRFKKKDGSWCWIESRFRKFFNEKFVMDELVCISRDIHDRVLTQQMLKASEQKYRNLVETAQDFICTLDASGNFTYINPAGLKKTGYSEPEITGSHFSDLIRKDWREKVVRYFQRFCHNGTESGYMEFPLVTKAGAEWWVGQSFQTVQVGGDIAGFQVYARDITDKRKAEDAILEQNEFIHAILDGLPINIMITDRSGKVIYLNNYAATKFLKSRELIVGKYPADFLPEEWIPLFQSGDDAAWENGFYIGEERALVKGVERVLIVSKSIIQLPAYAEPALLRYSINITERKQMEEILQKAKQQLEASVAVKDKLISVVSHEIRTPMNAVMGITHLLMQQEADQDQRKYLDVLRVSSENLIRILNNVFDISKIESGNMVFERSDFNIREVIDRVVALFSFSASEKNICIGHSVDERIPEFIKGDHQRLVQILRNLMCNAVKFTEQGKISLAVRLLGKAQDVPHLLFTIEDTGIGIPANKIHSIFDSFTQEKYDASKKYEGMGLGLTLAKKLIELQGGNISVESQISRGSVFTFDLYFDKASPEADKRILVNSGILSGLRTLVVEDNRMNQLIVCRFLEQQGIKADTAENGLEAIERLKTEVYDIVLMDLQMPEMDGFKTSEYIRKQLRLEMLPIIAFTASCADDIEHKIAGSGMNDYIVKPFEPSEFYNIIAKHTVQPNSLRKTIITMSENQKLTNLQYLKEASAGNAAFIKQMIDIFLRQTPDYLEKLKSFSEEKNWEEFRKVMHKLKPTVTMMGIKEGENLIKEIEHRVKGQLQLETVKPDVLKLEGICIKSFEELKEQLVSL